MQRLKGIAITEGTAAGRAVLLVQRGRAIRFPVPPERIEDEVTRLDRAHTRSRTQLESIKERIRRGPGSELAPLFDAQLLILDDPMLIGRAAELIRTEHVNAEWAVQRAFDDIAHVFDAIEDPYLRERRGDVEDVMGRVRMNLHEGPSAAPRDLLRDVEGPFVLIADELSPSVAAQIDWDRVRGFAMDAGSRTYHTAILARSLQIPAIVGLHDATARVRAGDTVALDGSTGELIIDPSADVLRSVLTRQRTAAQDTTIPHGPATTTDNVCIRLEANVELPDDVAVAQRYGADGIGLFRSELLLAGGSPEAIGEDEQFLAYRKLVEAMAPRPVTIRTFDLEENRYSAGRRTGDPPDRRVGDDRVRNPLGLRGLRLGLARPDMLERQLRAVLRAAAVGPVRILLPFVSRVEEVRAARTVIDTIAEQLGAEGIDVPDVPLGAMIEVPSAALIADLLAAEVEFLAIGTNDLIQYTLAVDRTDERVSQFYRPLHPAMLRLLRLVRRAAARGGVPLSVCGEMASDPALLAVLIGLGLTDFSMTPGAIPGARRLIESVSASELRAAVRGALVLSTVEEVEDYLSRAIAGIQQALSG
jgi:phosphotransferase system enzyme I (PtsI)